MKHKSLSLKLQTCSRSEFITCVGDSDRQRWFDGKSLMLLLNSQRIDTSQETITDSTKESKLHWLPFRMTQPTTTHVTMTRKQYQPDSVYWKSVIGLEEDPINYFEADQANMRNYPYQFAISDNDVYHEIRFDVSQDLVTL